MKMRLPLLAWAWAAAVCAEEVAGLSEEETQQLLREVFDCAESVVVNEWRGEGGTEAYFRWRLRWKSGAPRGRCRARSRPTVRRRPAMSGARRGTRRKNLRRVREKVSLFRRGSGLGLCAIASERKA